MQQSLRTKDPTTAKMMALEYCLALAKGNAIEHDPRLGVSTWTANLSSGEFSASGDDDQRQLIEFLSKNPHLLQMYIDKAKAQIAAAVAMNTTVPERANAADGGRPLKELAALHLDKEARTMQSLQTVHEKKVVLEEFMEVFGADAGIRTISAEDISRMWIPIENKRPNKKYEGKFLSLPRLEKRRGYLSKFFEWARTSKFYLAENPMQVQMATKKQIRDQTVSYAEFNGDDLKSLFKAKFKAFMAKPDWYWPPLIALFSGARLSEVCNLEIEAIGEIEGVKIYEILKGKTKKSKRVVPVHPILLELGFWDYVQNLRAKNEDFLFPDRISRSSVSKSLGRRWAQWIDTCGIRDKRKVFHSFRSTAITDLHNASANAEAIKKAVGHSSTGIDDAHGGYVRGQILQALVDAIGKLVYPTIDFSNLKLEDPAFIAYYQAADAKKNSAAEIERVRKNAAHKEAKAARSAT